MVIGAVGYGGDPLFQVLEDSATDSVCGHGRTVPSYLRHEAKEGCATSLTFSFSFAHGCVGHQRRRQMK